MEFDITLKNYRCFPDEKPATLELRRGLTALIGPNNSGKSAALRFFYEFRPFFEQASNSAALHQMLALKNSWNANFPPEVLDPEEVFSFTNDRPLSVSVTRSTGRLTRNPAIISLDRGQNVMRMQITGINIRGYANGTYLCGAEQIPQKAFEDVFSPLGDVAYIGAFRNALNRGENVQRYYDMSVGQSFISEWADMQSGNSEQLNRAASAVVESIKQIFGFEQLSIGVAPHDRSLNFVTNGRSLKDHEVGSGLTQVLMVLATVARKRPLYLLIDEPELNLHPSLQVKFLMALATYVRAGIIFGTHSVGLARTVADRIYSVQQLRDGCSEIRRYEDTQNLAELLGEMSFSAYRDMGFQKILLVEGRTDVKVLQQFLRTFRKDHTVIPVPLGGSAMICGEAEHELAELLRFGAGVSALIDSEKKSANEEIDEKRTQFADVCRKLGIACSVLDRRAIENYFPAQAIASAFPIEGYQALGPYEKLGEARPGWAKAESWRIASEVAREELTATDLGRFLEGL